MQKLKIILELEWIHMGLVQFITLILRKINIRHRLHSTILVLLLVQSTAPKFITTHL